MGEKDEVRRDVDREETVDEIVDDLDPARIERCAESLGLTTDELLGMVITETRARIAP